MLTEDVADETLQLSCLIQSVYSVVVRPPLSSQCSNSEIIWATSKQNMEEEEWFYEILHILR